MSSFIYRSTSKLICECDSEVIVCVNDGLLKDGSNFLSTTLDNIIETADCNGCSLYNYYLTYDENLLVDPTHIMTSFDVTGIVCAGCLVAYLRYLIASALAPV